MSQGFARIVSIISQAKRTTSVIEDAKNGVVITPEDIAGDRGAKVKYELDMGWMHLNTSIRVVAGIELTCDSSPEIQDKAFTYCKDLVNAWMAEELSEKQTLMVKVDD